MVFQRILIPLDGSALAERAIDQARKIAGPQTVLHLLSVIEEDRAIEFAQIGPMFGTVGGAPTSPTAYTQNLYSPVVIQQRESYMREWTEKLQADGYKVSQQIICGNPKN